MIAPKSVHFDKNLAFLRVNATFGNQTTKIHSLIFLFTIEAPFQKT